MHGSKRTYRAFQFDNTFVWKSVFAGTLSVPGNPSVAVGNPPVFKGTPDVWSPEDFLTNAVEVLAGKGTLHCRVHRSRARGRSGVPILVADDGPGIAPEHRKRVFEPFFTTKGQNGADLGLWMAKVQKIGGPLRVRSGPQGRQTCFVGFLPVPGPVLSAELDQITLNSLAQQLNRTQITLQSREGQLDCAQNPSPIRFVGAQARASVSDGHAQRYRQKAASYRSAGRTCPKGTGRRFASNQALF